MEGAFANMGLTPSYLGTCLGRTDRDVTAAGRYVEDALTGGDPTRRDDDRTDLPHLLAREPMVVAQSPYGARLSHVIRRHFPTS
jgi:hypothetical protein